MSFAEQFTETKKLAFQDNARLAAQYTRSVLRATVMAVTPENAEADSPVTYYDPAKGQRREGRVPTNRDNPVNRRRRWLMYQPPFDSGEYIDTNDKFQGMTNFESPLMKTHTSAVLRNLDEDIIMEGIYGDAFEGKRGEVTKTFAAGQIIGGAVQDGAGADAVGLNLAKVKASWKKFAGNLHAQDASSEFFMPVTSQQIIDLSDELELTSKEYRAEARPAFDQSTGALARIWNHTLVQYENIPTKTVTINSESVTVQRVPAYKKDCIALAMWEDLKHDAWPDPGKYNELYMNAWLRGDCRRLDETGVNEIECLVE